MLVLGDRPGRLALAGLGLIAAGALTLAGGFRDADELFGYALLLTAAFLWAAGTVRMRRSRLTALEATALICVGSLVTYIPLYLASGCRACWRRRRRRWRSRRSIRGCW